MLQPYMPHSEMMLSRDVCANRRNAPWKETLGVPVGLFLSCGLSGQDALRGILTMGDVAQIKQNAKGEIAYKTTGISRSCFPSLALLCSLRQFPLLRVATDLVMAVAVKA